MIVQQVATSRNDEFYTPEYAIRPILKYIKPNSNIWCPFDTKESLFYKILIEEGHKVYATHIDEGKDFFKMDCPPRVEYIISNPPYSIKIDILERLFSFEVPFAMLVGVAGLFDSKRKFELFSNNKFEVMYLNKRVSFFTDYNNPILMKGTPFQSVYLCHKMLPQQIVFEEV